jgi:TorA maturation chaperone TorD
MENLELEYHQNIANAYDLLRVVFFNRWTKDTIWEPKKKAEVLSSDLKDSAFVKSLEALEGETLDEARWEYNKLFIGPKMPLANPFESVHRSQKKLMMREFTFEVREFYAQVGLKVENEGRFPDDFIGFEFQYLFYVSQLVVELINSGKEEEAKELILVRKEFLVKHTNQWFPKFCDDVSNQSEEQVWKNLASFILNISKIEEEFFKTLLNK